MNITNKQDETLFYAAKKFAEKLHNGNAGDYKLHDKDCFINGANWQKEQDKVVIDKLVGALEKAERLLNIEGWTKTAYNIRELLQSLK